MKKMIFAALISLMFLPGCGGLTHYKIVVTRDGKQSVYYSDFCPGIDDGFLQFRDEKTKRWTIVSMPADCFEVPSNEK